VPFGFCVEDSVIDEQVITRRMIGAINRPIVVWIFQGSRPATHPAKSRAYCRGTGSSARMVSSRVA
jgi:hypothetical protein